MVPAATLGGSAPAEPGARVQDCLTWQNHCFASELVRIHERGESKSGGHGKLRPSSAVAMRSRRDSNIQRSCQANVDIETFQRIASGKHAEGPRLAE